MLLRLRTPEAVVGNLVAWLRQIGLIFAAHAGLIVLVALVAGWPWPRHDPAPVIVRRAVDPFARQFVYFFAVAPAFAGTLVAVLLGWSGPVGGIAPLVILSGLLVVVAAGDAIEFSRQRVVIAAWFGLLVVPPIMAVAALVVLPWLNIDLRVTYPADAMARFFAESFERRIGTAAARGHGRPWHRRAGRARRPQPSEPLSERTPERSPWVTADTVKTRGAIVVWPTTDTAGAPPPAHQGAFSGSRSRGSSRVRALGAGPAAAHAHRLGVDQAASGQRQTERRKPSSRRVLSRAARAVPSVISFAFAHLSAEDPVHEYDIAEDDRQQDQRPCAA